MTLTAADRTSEQDDFEQTDSASSKSTGSRMKLAQTLGLFNGIAIIVGTIVGSGIFVSPAGVLIESGSVGLALIVWFVCGIMCLLGAHSFAELGTLITKSGGIYAYIQLGIGDLAGFLYLWVLMLVLGPAGNAIIALTFGYYILQPFYPGCSSNDAAVRLLAAVAIMILTFVNAASVKWATRIQDVFTVIKTLTLIIIICTGIGYICIFGTPYFQNSFEGSTTSIGSLSLAFYSGLFSYSGWYTLNFLTEELQEPHKNLPRAIWLSMPLVTVIYTLTNVAYFGVLSAQEIIHSEAVAVTFAMRVFGKFGLVMPVCVAFSTFGSLNGCIMSMARVCFVGSREGHLPMSVSLISQTRMTPMPAVIIQGAFSVLMLVTSDVYLLINCLTFVETLTLLACTLTIFIFRRTMPNHPRSIKVSLVWPSLFLVACVILVIFPLYQDPVGSGIGILITCTGIPVYIFGVVWKKPKYISEKSDNFTKLIQKLIIGLPDESEYKDL